VICPGYRADASADRRAVGSGRSRFASETLSVRDRVDRNMVTDSSALAENLGLFGTETTDDLEVVSY